MSRPIFYVAAADEQPMSQLNTTPLIDVMLVLLVMFIILVPVLHHKVAIDLPTGVTQPGAPPTIHRLDLNASNHLSWDGMPISRASLPGRLKAMREDLNAELHLSADGSARYEAYNDVVVEVKRAGITRLGLLGNQAFEKDIGR